MRDHGFTLTEVLVALAVLCGASLGGAHLLVISLRANADARAQTMTAALATTRMEQLRGLTFEYDSDGQRVTDVTANLSAENPATGGGGLSSAGADSLAANVPGFVDYVDGNGRWVGNGASPPADAVFVRRWSVDPSGPAADLIVVQVLVRPVETSPIDAVRRSRAESRFVTAITRTER